MFITVFFFTLSHKNILSITLHFSMAVILPFSFNPLKSWWALISYQLLFTQALPGYGSVCVATYTNNAKGLLHFLNAIWLLSLFRWPFPWLPLEFVISAVTCFLVASSALSLVPFENNYGPKLYDLFLFLIIAG